MRTRRTRFAALAALALVALSCGPKKGPDVPGGGPEFTVLDIVMDGDAMVAWTSMGVLRESPLTSVLLEGLEREMVEKVSALGPVLEATDRAPLEQADRIVITGRSLDQNSAILAVGVSYTEDVDWFDEFVLGFQPDGSQEGVLADLDGGARLGVIARDTQLTWGTDLHAAVCAIKLTDRVVAYLAAPDAGECKFWAGWVLSRRQGDPVLLGKIAQAPETPDAEPPLAVYIDGDAFQTICCAPWGLAEKMYGVDEAWLGLDPGSPAHLAVKVAFSDPALAQGKRDALAKMLDTYLPFVEKMSPGLAGVLAGVQVAVDEATLTISLSIGGDLVTALSDLLSTML